MTLLFCPKYAGYYYDPEEWRRELPKLVPGLEVRVWPELGRPEDIVMAVADFAPPGLFAALPNLACVLYPGYGPNEIIASGEVPGHVTIARLADPGIARQMTEYVVLYVLHRHRRVREHEAQQRAARWALIEAPETALTTVGLMGLGRLGSAFAEGLRPFGFRLAAWTRTARTAPGIEAFHGEAGLARFLGRCDIVVASLPSTPVTRDLINARSLALFKPGATLINLGRGDFVVEADLIAALDAGRLAGAVLDVHRPSPLPSQSPLWRHPKVIVTPHDSGAKMGPVLPEVAEAYRLVAAGQCPPNVVDRVRGY
ncbi:MAG: glyoxylate/hydroxypyruvate reductase A [Alphaproteobacteria bacterium]